MIRLSLDIGTKFIGSALAKDKTVIPLATHARANGVAEREILALIEHYQVSEIVIGLPLNDDNSESPMCDNVRRFARRLARRTTIKIVYHDEYGSTYAAGERLGSTSGKGPNIDAHAAAIILEEYLRDCD